MANVDSQILLLKSSDINSSKTYANYYNTTIITSRGKVAENRTKLTWSNIDLQLVMGDMYDKYDRFKICQNFVGSSETGTGTETNADYRHL